MMVDALRKFHEVFRREIANRYANSVYQIIGTSLLNGHIKYAGLDVSTIELLDAIKNDEERSEDAIMFESKLWEHEIMDLYTEWENRWRGLLKDYVRVYTGVDKVKERGEIWEPISQLRAMRNYIAHRNPNKGDMQRIQQSAWAGALSHGNITITNAMMLDFYNNRLTFDNLVHDVSKYMVQLLGGKPAFTAWLSANQANIEDVSSAHAS